MSTSPTTVRTTPRATSVSVMTSSHAGPTRCPPPQHIARRRVRRRPDWHRSDWRVRARQGRIEPVRPRSQGTVSAPPTASGRQLSPRGPAPWAGATALVVLAVVVLYFFTGAAATRDRPGRRRSPPTDITYGPEDAPAHGHRVLGLPVPVLRRVRQVAHRAPRQVRRPGAVRLPLLSALQPPVRDHRGQGRPTPRHLQGKFWEMHDLLFENQDEWASSRRPAPLLRLLRREPRPRHGQVPRRRRRPVHRRTSSSGRRRRARRPA